MGIINRTMLFEKLTPSSNPHCPQIAPSPSRLPPRPQPAIALPKTRPPPSTFSRRLFATPPHHQTTQAGPTTMSNPPSSPPQSHHLPPSLPNSPIAKRLKTMTSAPPSTPSPRPLAQTPPLLVKKLSPAATAPTRGSAFAAGYDIYSARATTIPARGKGMVETDLAIAVPEGTCEFSLLSSEADFDLFLPVSLFAFRVSLSPFVSLSSLSCHSP